MRVRSLKITISFIFMTGLGFYLWVFHGPDQVLIENQKAIQNRIFDFKNKIQELEAGQAFLHILTEAREGSAMTLDSRPMESIIHRNFLDLEVYQKNSLRFWSTNVDESVNGTYLPSGISLQRFKTGWFLVNKVNSGGIFWVFRTPVEHEFEFPNSFLRNGFLGIFKIPDYFQIIKENKPLSKPIVNPDTRKTIGYIQLDKNRYLKSLDGDQIVSIFLFLLIFLFILQTACSYFLEKKYILLSIIIGIALPAGCFYFISQFFYRHKLVLITLLDSKIFSDPPFFNSLGDFTLFILYFFWIIYFVGNLFPGINAFIQKAKPWKVRLCGFFFMGLVSYGFSFLFRSLIFHSNTPLNLTNIFNLNPDTFLVFGLLSLACLAYYYSLNGLIRIIRENKISHNQDPGYLVVFFFIGISFYSWKIEGLYLSLGLSILWIIIYVFGKSRSIYRLALFLIGISLITSIQIADLSHSIEKSGRIALARILSNNRDTIAERKLVVMSKEIQKDPVILDRENNGPVGNLGEFQKEIQKRYFERSFPNFDIQFYVYNPKGLEVYGSDNISLESFQSVKDFSGAKKVTPYFYQVLGKIGFNNYLGLIPIPGNGFNSSGTLVIRLNARFIRENNSFQELLLAPNHLNSIKTKAYSYALYRDSSLIDKYGKYPYSINPGEFLPMINKEKLKFQTIREYDHLIYHPTKGEYLIVSIPSVSLYKQGTLFSYILGFNLIFIGLLAILVYLFNQLKEIKGFKRVFEQFSSSRLLYKTRIQVSIVASVFLSLIVIGWITLAYVNNQYDLQQRDLLSNEINNLRIVFEQEMPTDSISHYSEKNNLLFRDFSASHSQDLNFYNTEGDLVFSSLPKVFERGLLSQKMSPDAYYEMFVSGRTEYIQDEIIGKLNFLSGYTPVRNNINNQVVGYLNLPYFANQIELKQRLSGFSNSLINVYIISFLLIGLFAIALANSLTSPLSLVEKSLGSTQIGDMNRPIPWKRDDEIGDLIKGYNTMIRTLEESARKLAKSERESAWREMAKQVAHEIKNPLTPLKLGVQHLERSWKEKDKNFEEKFQRFTKTFIEQIDSLSAISTEFSNFAQMPPAHEEIINVLDVLDRVIHLFQASEDIKIELVSKIREPRIFADRDQLSRAFTNLIKNSVQALPENQPGLIRVEVQDLEQKIRILINDNGMGIPKELYPKIFQPNFTTKGSGTGFGLAFVKNVIEQMGGTIDFTSEVSKGTCFSIEIPVFNEN